MFRLSLPLNRETYLGLCGLDEATLDPEGELEVPKPFQDWSRFDAPVSGGPEVEPAKPVKLDPDSIRPRKG